MISMSNNSSTRREIGLGFGGGIEEEMMMEDSDFEEDSIHSYVSCVDPDLALSYIVNTPLPLLTSLEIFV